MAMDPIGTPLFKPFSNAAYQFENHLRSLQHKNAVLQSEQDLLWRENEELKRHLQCMIEEADWQKQESIGKIEGEKRAMEMEVAGLQSMVENLRDAVYASQGLCNQNAEDYGVAVDRLEREKNDALSCLKQNNRWWGKVHGGYIGLMLQKCVVEVRLGEAERVAAEAEGLKLVIERLEKERRRMRGLFCTATAVAVAASVVACSLWNR